MSHSFELNRPTAAPREDQPIHLVDVPTLPVDAEPLLDVPPSLLTEAGAEAGIGEQLDHVRSERVEVMRTGQQADSSVLDDLGSAAAVKRHDGQPHGHGLEVDEAERLLQ